MADETREFVRNFELCFLTVKTQKYGNRRPFVPQAASGPKTIQGYLVTKGLKETMTDYPLEYLQEEAEPIVPSIGYYNVSLTEHLRPTAFYVDLAPTRQYRKALDCSGQVSVNIVGNGSVLATSSLAALPASRIMSVKSKLLAYSLSVSPGRNFVPFREAVARVESGEAHSLAVSRFLAVALFPHYSIPLILFKNNVAGLVDGNIVAGNDQLLPLKDFFEKKWNITLRSFKDIS